jgi:hypothetical protein
VQIRAAHPAGGDLDENFARAGRRHHPRAHDKRRARALEHHGVHHGHDWLSLSVVADYISRTNLYLVMPRESGASGKHRPAIFLRSL